MPREHGARAVEQGLGGRRALAGALHGQPRRRPRLRLGLAATRPLAVGLELVVVLVVVVVLLLARVPPPAPPLLFGRRRRRRWRLAQLLAGCSRTPRRRDAPVPPCNEERHAKQASVGAAARQSRSGERWRTGRRAASDSQRARRAGPGRAAARRELTQAMPSRWRPGPAAIPATTGPALAARRTTDARSTANRRQDFANGQPAAARELPCAPAAPAYLERAANAFAVAVGRLHSLGWRGRGAVAAAAAACGRRFPCRASGLRQRRLGTQHGTHCAAMGFVSSAGTTPAATPTPCRVPRPAWAPRRRGDVRPALGGPRPRTTRRARSCPWATAGGCCRSAAGAARRYRPRRCPAAPPSRRAGGAAWSAAGTAQGRAVMPAGGMPSVRTRTSRRI